MLLPLYSILSFFSVCFPSAYVYLEGWTEFFQGIALYSFLMLLCDFLAPNDQHRIYFFAFLRIPKRTNPKVTTDGLSWLQRTWYFVLQYPFVAFVVAIIQCITEAKGVYCLESHNAHFAHIWVRPVYYLVKTVQLTVSHSSMSSRSDLLRWPSAQFCDSTVT